MDFGRRRILDQTGDLFWDGFLEMFGAFAEAVDYSILQCL